MDDLTKIEIRKALPGDAAEVLGIVREAFQSYQSQAGMENPPAAMTEEMPDVLRDIGQNIVLCAFYEGALAGSVRLKKEGPGLYFYRFAVRPGYQRTGIGKELVRESEKIAKELAVSEICLHTAKNIERLVRFYKRQGFSVREVNESKGYPRALMVKTIK